MAKMDDCLKKAADARRLSISLGNLAYSGEVCKELLEFSTKMEKVYRNLQKLLNDKVEDESKYKGLLAIINEKLEWFTKAEARFGNRFGFCFAAMVFCLNQKRNICGSSLGAIHTECKVFYVLAILVPPGLYHPIPSPSLISPCFPGRSKRFAERYGYTKAKDKEQEGGERNKGPGE